MISKLIYYFNTNEEFIFKDIFNNFEQSIYDSQKHYTKRNIDISLLLEIICIIFYVLFYIEVIVYLHYSNNIIIKNIIFLFLDFSEKCYDKNKFNNTNNLIILKLKELQYIIDDFDIKSFEKYAMNLDNINNNQFLYLKNEEINNLNNEIKENNNNNKTSENGSNSNNNNNNFLSNSFKKNERKASNRNLIESISSKNSNFFLDNKNKGMNNSSHNYLVESSKFFKNNLNSHSFSMSNDLLSSKSEENPANSKANNSKHYSDKNNLDKNKTIEQDNYHDILLNNSNKSLVLKCKIFFVMIFGLLVILIVVLYFKFKYILSFEKKYKRFFNDISILTNRYIQIYYYFNTFRALLIFPDDNRKTNFEIVMENMNEKYDIQNKNFIEITSKYIDNYKEISELFKIIKNSNNSTKILKEDFCFKNDSCESYLDSKYNIINTGIDFAFKSSMTQIMNLFLDYKRLNNKTDIKDIKEMILSTKNTFQSIMKCLNYFFIYVIRKIFNSFTADEKDFKKHYIKYISFLNIVSIIYSILLFFFVVVYIFVSLSKYIKPVKESAFRINCSLYFIKQYSLVKRYKLE